MIARSFAFERVDVVDRCLRLREFSTASVVRVARCFDVVAERRVRLKRVEEGWSGMLR